MSADLKDYFLASSMDSPEFMHIPRKYFPDDVDKQYNIVGTGHKIHFQPKNPARAKLAAINNKNGCSTGDV